ncbi:hypothetical protein BN7_1827 [Wickerhamomyces ciferrii]|uniref:Protein farnesyltransferase subunit beta n=1 Tax=Wickerhamomyces ciferrii (strain ATCC 14091 / BCRC 22168 / CBS 111 / JCM 3599 / NBRC 0793 / NRRL Y-1031 F-60-10) TaxID=1206466 RepID=K0KMG4_WICCF|nr:uncharacterized protein BN7_1827 [Wickerhamomyces ciferrii]CCH42283.1 hypothetical protein BN7_1827 [Wickerhamomyces ciferrii]
MSSASDLAKAQYLLKLLGKRRVQVTTEIEEDSSQFDLMIDMTENGTNFEEELLTATTEEQKRTEDTVKGIYDDLIEEGRVPHLLKDKHEKYLNAALGQLPPAFKGLDASQPWIYYWVINSMKLLQLEVSQDVKDQTARKLLGLQHKDGGLGGGVGQIGHAAATYAGTLALTLLEDEETWNKINRDQLYKWLLSIKQDDGSFVMHLGGEKDTRAVYCALVIASLFDLLTPELTKGTAEWLAKCQTYEGGFGGVPYDEAHGGYTFCGAAALVILGKDVFTKTINVEKLVKWTVVRQLRLEGGFSGRSNKLVDGCYSFWVGGLIPIFDIFLDHETASRAGLQNYILGCCQNEQMGGLRDKPGKYPDFYHTNYVLLGLTVVQNKFKSDDFTPYTISSEPSDHSVVSVEGCDKLDTINPIFGLPKGYAERFHSFFATKTK